MSATPGMSATPDGDAVGNEPVARGAPEYGASGSETLGLGVIGLGWMGELHSRAAARLGFHFPELPRVQLQAACSRSEAGLRRAESLGFASATADAEELIADPGVQIVSVCTPNDRQAELAAAVLRAGKILWVEKPVGVGAAEAEQVARAAGALPHGVGFNYRQAPAIAWLREAVREGRLGRIVDVSADYAAGYASDPRSPLTWRFLQKQAGGGASADLLGHVADLVAYTVGEIGAVTGRTRIVIPRRPLPAGAGGHFSSETSEEMGDVENDDTAHALVEIPESATTDAVFGRISASRIAHGAENQLTLEIRGTRGTAQWSAERLTELVLSDQGEAGAGTAVKRLLVGPAAPEMARFQPGPGFEFSFDDLKVVELANILRWRAGVRPAANAGLDQAVHAARVCEAVQRSAASGLWERV